MGFYSYADNLNIADRFKSYPTDCSIGGGYSSFSSYSTSTPYYSSYSSSSSGLSTFSGWDRGYSYSSSYKLSGLSSSPAYKYEPTFNTSAWQSIGTASYSFASKNANSYSFPSFDSKTTSLSSYGPSSYSFASLTRSSYSAGSFGTSGFSYSTKPSLFESGTSSRSLAFSSVSYRPESVNYSYSAVSKDVQAKLGPEFLAKVKEVANNINCDYKDLLAVMNAESGLNPAKQNNAGHEMFGLIQFSADSAKTVGTTHAKLVKMSAVEQMKYVEKYYKHWIKAKGWQGKCLSAADLYALTLAPGRAGKDVLYTRGVDGENYTANAPIDTNFGDGDGKIEKADCEAFIASKRVNETIFA